MKWFRSLIILLLFLIPAALIYYKVSVLGVSFLPVASVDEWSVQINVKPEALVTNDGSNVSIPLPADTAAQSMRSMEIKNSHLYSVNHTDAGRLLSISQSYLDDPTRPLTILLHATTKGFEHPSLKTNARFNSGRVAKKYMDLSALTEEEKAQLTKVENAIYFPQDKKVEKLEKIFYFITEEIQFTPTTHTLTEMLELYEGTEYTRSQLFTYLARRAGIPARTAVGVNLTAADHVRENHFRVTYYNEVWVNGAWYPVNVDEQEMGRVPANLLTLYRDLDEVHELLEQKGWISIYAQPEKLNPGDASRYVGQFQRANSFLARGLLYNLPPALHTIFYAVLLIPFGAVILSLCRNIVGLNTFGIFTPVLLALFFLETSLAFGVTFFLVVLALGFFQRYVLDRFYLLAVPRLGILLTLVVLTYLTFALLSAESEIFGFPNRNLNYFPIVIVTVFIERFSVYFIEEGPWNTIKTLVGTFVIAFFCFLLFSVDLLKQVVFTHPELLLVAIALNMMIGQFKGYRLLEAFRFTEFKKEA